MFKFLDSFPKRWNIVISVITVVLAFIGLFCIIYNLKYIIDIIVYSLIAVLLIVVFLFDVSYNNIQAYLQSEYKNISSCSETFPTVLQNTLCDKALTLPQHCSTADCKTTDIKYEKVMFFAQKENEFKGVTLINSPFHYINNQLSYKNFIPVLVFSIPIDKLAVTNVTEFITCVNDVMRSYCLNLSVVYYQVCQKLGLEQELKMVSKAIIDFDEETENVKMDLELMNELKKLKFPIDSDGNIINCVPAVVDVKKTRNRQLQLYVAYTNNPLYAPFVEWYNKTKKGVVVNDNF